MPIQDTTRSQVPDAISGIQAPRGEGVQETQGFWADAWSQVIRRPGAIMGILWVTFVAFLAIFAPIIASGHPLVLRELSDSGEVIATSSPLRDNLTPVDWLLMIGAVLATIWLLLPVMRRSTRLGILLIAALQAGLTLAAIMILRSIVKDADSSSWISGAAPIVIASIPAALFAAASVLLSPSPRNRFARLIPALVAASVAVSAVMLGWTVRLPNFDYHERELAGEIDATYTIVPWSPAQRFTDRTTKTLPPGSTSGQALRLNLTFDLKPGVVPDDRKAQLVDRAAALTIPAESAQDLAEALRERLAAAPPAERINIRAILDEHLSQVGHTYPLGTDETGQDVLSQLIHACRLALSVGFVATSIAVLLGVTLGALMGYFGGIVDLLLYRVVEIFMSIPVLVILIVAAGVLPRNTYVMMAIIGCFTWHTIARFTRAEFFKLRNQDFVQAAQAVGLPLRSILFKHMLPNGVTPVLVDASFLIAFAILYESIISFLGFGPPEQASWGKLLADATSESGDFAWWLAIFPGLVIFLTVLSYNLIGESLRDAIDPKLKKGAGMTPEGTRRQGAHE